MGMERCRVLLQSRHDQTGEQDQLESEANQDTGSLTFSTVWLLDMNSGFLTAEQTLA